jgi:hypothetical protein
VGVSAEAVVVAKALVEDVDMAEAAVAAEVVADVNAAVGLVSVDEVGRLKIKSRDLQKPNKNRMKEARRTEKDPLWSQEFLLQSQTHLF